MQQDSIFQDYLPRVSKLQCVQSHPSKPCRDSTLGTERENWSPSDIYFNNTPARDEIALAPKIAMVYRTRCETAEKSIEILVFSASTKGNRNDRPREEIVSSDRCPLLSRLRGRRPFPRSRDKTTFRITLPLPSQKSAYTYEISFIRDSFDRSFQLSLSHCFFFQGLCNKSEVNFLIPGYEKLLFRKIYYSSSSRRTVPSSFLKFVQKNSKFQNFPDF